MPKTDQQALLDAYMRNYAKAQAQTVSGGAGQMTSARQVGQAAMNAAKTDLPDYSGAVGGFASAYAKQVEANRKAAEKAAKQAAKEAEKAAKEAAEAAEKQEQETEEKQLAGLDAYRASKAKLGGQDGGEQTPGVLKRLGAGVGAGVTGLAAGTANLADTARRAVQQRAQSMDNEAFALAVSTRDEMDAELARLLDSGLAFEADGVTPTEAYRAALLTRDAAVEMMQASEADAPERAQAVQGLLDVSGGLSDTALTGLEGLPRLLGETGISIAQNLPALGLGFINPALGLGAMAASAAGSRAAELEGEGKGLGEALGRGLVSGGIEMLTEKLPMDALLDMVKTGGKGAVRQILQQAATEGGEESVSYLLNLLADAAAGDEAEFSLEELARSAAGGALSGGIMGSAGTLAGRALHPEPAANAPKTAQSRKTGSLPTLVETAPDGGNAAAVQGAVPTAEQHAAELAQGEQQQGVPQTVPGLVQTVPQAVPGLVQAVPGSEADQAAEPVQTLGQWLFGDEDAATGEPDAERDGAVYTLPKQAQAITGRGANAQDTIRVRKFLERLPEMSWEEAQAEAEKIAEEIVHEEDFYEVDPGQYENAPVPIQRALFDKQPIVVSEDDMEALHARFGEKDKRGRRLTPQQMGRKLGLKLVKSAPGAKGDDPSALWMTYDGVPIDLPDGVGSDYMGQFADLLVKWREDGGGGLVDTPSYEYAKRKAYADLLGLPEPGFEEYSGTQYDEAEQAGVPDEMTAEEIAAYSAEFAPQGEDLAMLEDWRAAAEDSLRARLNGTLPNLDEMMDEPVLDVAQRQGDAAAVKVPTLEGQPPVLRRGGQSGVLSPVQSAPDGLPESIGAMRSDPTSYSAMQNAYGTHEPGELAARVVDVPVSTDGTDRVSKAAQTIMEAAQTPDEMVELLEEQVRSGTFSHTVMSDRDAVRSAAAYIDGHGFDASAYEFLERVETDQPLDKNDIVRGQMLYTLAAQKGDTETAMNLAVYLARVATESGQNLQAQRLLKRLTPAGRLAYVTRVKETLERECREKYGMDGIDIPQHLADALLQAGPDDAKAQRQAMQDIYQAIADQLPASWAESLNAWRYMVMLTNPATHIRNVLGNIIMYPQRRLKNLLGTAMEQAIPQEQRTKAILTPADRALKEFARQDVDNVLDELESGQRYRDERNLIYRLRNPFVHAKNGQAHPTLASRALGGLNRMNSDLMGAEDMVFKRSTYADTLAQVLKARGLDPETMSTEELNEVRAIAIEEAQRATFTEANQIADLIGRIERTNAVTRVLVGGILPFKATPMNIVRRSVAYSPAGLVGALGRGAWDARHGSFNAARFVDDLAQGLSGTSIFMLGAFLAAQGILNCAGSDKKKEQGLEDAQGYQDYSVNLGGGSYTIDWWGPTAVAMFAGAALYEANQDKGADAWNNLATALMNSTEPLFDMTMLEGVNSAIQTASYGGSAPVTAIASTMATNFATQLIPTLSGQVARAVDGTRRTVYTDKTGFAGEVDKTVQKVKNKIPGLSQDNQPYVDIWGRTQDIVGRKTWGRTQDIVGGNTAGRLAYGMLSPGYYAPQTVTDADRLVESVYELTGDSSVIPGLMSSSVSVEGESVKLTPEQYTAAKQTKGQAAYSIMDGLADDPSFDSLSAEQQGKVLSAANSLASELAKMEVIPSLMEAHEQAVAGGTLTKTGRLAQLYMTGGADAVIPYLEMNVLKNAVSSDYKDGKAVSGSKKKNFIAAAMQAGYTYEQAEYAYDKVL